MAEGGGPPVLVTGSHRGGTTFVGDILRRSGRFTYLDEPLNARRGLAGVDTWFAYASLVSATPVNPILDRLAAGRARYRRRVVADPGIVGAARAIGRLVIGAPSEWRGRLRRWGIGRDRPLLLKDPLAMFAAEYLNTRHDARVIVSVRHPAAFVLSLRRVGWPANPASLLAQTALIREKLPEAQALAEKTNGDPAAMSAAFWRLLYAPLVPAFAEKRPGFLFVRHEDLSIDPLAGFAAIFDFAGIAMTDADRERIAAATHGESATAREGRVHDLTRDSAALAWSWKDVLGEAETATIRRVAGPVADHFYRDDEWR